MGFRAAGFGTGLPLNVGSKEDSSKVSVQRALKGSMGSFRGSLKDFS